MVEQLPEDLQRLLSDAREQVKDNSRVWVKSSATYASSLSICKGLLLGGSLSPFFLDKRQMSDNADAEIRWNKIAAGVSMSQSRILYLDEIAEASEQSTLQSWVPILESCAKAKDGLLIVSPHFENKVLLAMLLVNNDRGRLQCVVINPGELSEAAVDRLQPKGGSRLDNFFNKGMQTKISELNRESLLLFDQVWIRRDASVAFPISEDDKDPANILQDVAVIEVGGRSADDLMHRLKLVSDEIATW